MGSIMDQERPWEKERLLAEKQRKCHHKKTKEVESWYYFRTVCSDCGKEMKRNRDPAR